MQGSERTSISGDPRSPDRNYENAKVCMMLCSLLLLALAVSWFWCVIIPKEDMRSYCEWQNMTKKECKSFWYPRNPHTYWLRDR
jgi:hypothetical protein